jgi:hypothetical protein
MKWVHKHRWVHFVLYGVFAFSCLVAVQVYAETYYVVISGLGGEPDYEQRFTSAAKQLDKTFKASGTDVHTSLLTGDQATYSHLKEVLQSVAGAVKSDDDFVLILIGHGSFDGNLYKFNLPGPDISAPEIADLCNRIRTRRQLIVDTTSASGGAIPALQRQGRAIITATKSGTEKNATVFARYWVEAFEDPSADTDKSGSLSALEAFTYATQKTASFYDSQKRLATEHAVFVDTLIGAPVRESGQREGALLSSLTLLRAGSTQQAANNPARLALLQKKEKLEQKIDILKYQKAAMDPSEYRQQLTTLLLELAHTQQEMDQ